MASRVRSPLAPENHQLLPRDLRAEQDRSSNHRQRTGIKRKVSLRDSYLRRLKKEGRRVTWNRNGQIKRQKPIKKVSRSLRERLKVYQFLAAQFLALPENKLCLICTVRREHGENIVINCATEIHHLAGRIKRLLCYVPFFRASCFPCRTWPHDYPAQAREWGLLAPATQWNRFPDEGKA